jgi:hypothetical protein
MIFGFLWLKLKWNFLKQFSHDPLASVNNVPLVVPKILSHPS